MVSSFFSTWLWSRTKSHWASSAFGDQAMAPSYLSSAKEYWWARRCSVLLQSLLARCQFLCTLITSKELESDDNGGAMKNHNKLWGCIEMDLFRSWGTNKTSVLCYSRFKKKKNGSGFPDSLIGINSKDTGNSTFQSMHFDMPTSTSQECCWNAFTFWVVVYLLYTCCNGASQSYLWSWRQARKQNWQWCQNKKGTPPSWCKSKEK